MTKGKKTSARKPTRKLTKNDELVLKVLRTIKFDLMSPCPEGRRGLRKYGVNALYRFAEEARLIENVERYEDHPFDFDEDENLFRLFEAAGWVEWLGVALAYEDCINAPKVSPKDGSYCSYTETPRLRKGWLATAYYPKDVLLDGCRRYVNGQRRDR